MPPKVEAALLALVLAGAWIVMENSHRIDLTQPDDEASRWTTVASCQPPGARYSAGSALAAGGDTADGCASAYRSFTAATSDAVAVTP
jgi:hypothetical protein